MTNEWPDQSLYLPKSARKQNLFLLQSQDHLQKLSQFQSLAKKSQSGWSYYWTLYGVILYRHTHIWCTHNRCAYTYNIHTNTNIHDVHGWVYIQQVKDSYIAKGVGVGINNSITFHSNHSFTDILCWWLWWLAYNNTTSERKW